MAAATELFLAKGYAGATMADISAAAGVARGNVYWYFESKDHIFAAVMDRMLSREIRTLEAELADADPLTQLVRGLSDMRTYRTLHQAMHDRLPHSDAVREAHDTFLEWIDAMVDKLLLANRSLQDRADVDPAQLRDVVVAIFEGANVPNGRNRPAHEMIRLLIESLFANEKANRTESG